MSDKLAAISKALAAAENDPLQPACVVRAFLDPNPPVVFGITLPQVTMRGWLELELAGSPFVSGVWMEDPAARVEALCTAIAILSGKTPPEIFCVQPVATVLEAEVAVYRRVNSCFETFLPLRRKLSPGEKDETLKDPGTGWWIKLLAALLGDLKMSLEAALELPVAAAYALVAGHGTNAGKEVVGENWREREVMNRLEREASAVAFVEKCEQGQHAEGRAEDAQDADYDDGELQHG